MKRRPALVWVLLLTVALGGCVTAKQQREEQQELQRSISRTSDPRAVQGCAFIMSLRPEEKYGTPEAQTASLVIPKAGVAWVILEDSGGYQLYSCKTVEAPSRAEVGTVHPEPTPAVATVRPAPAVAPPPPAAAATPAPSVAPPGENAPAAEATKPDASDTRVTSNPEAVRGCRFLASFTEYQTVSRFRDAVARKGGDVAYVVASNRDGEVIGEAYRCGGP